MPRFAKRLGQHHLKSGRSCRPLVRFLAPEGQRVLEIGAGGGVLTRELLAAGARVLALEVDPAWAATLRRRIGPEPPIAVVDALELAWSRLPPGTLVAGNLPYNVASPILVQVLPLWERVPAAAFLLQKEVAERLTADPGRRAYGALSVLTRSYADAALLGVLPPSAFRPAPKVESAFVGLRLHRPPLPDDEMPGFLAFVRAAFLHKRKTLRNALAAVADRPRADATLEAAGVRPGSRAEELDLPEWLALWAVWRRGAAD